MARRLEPAHPPLSLASRLMRILGSVVQIPVLSMFHTGQNLAQGRPVAFQFVRDDHSWYIGESLQEFAEESLRRFLVSLALHQEIEDMPVLVDGAPQVVTLAMDGEKHLIQVPFIPRSGISTAQVVGIDLPELSAPIPDRFIGQDDAAFGHELFGVPVA